MMIKERKTPSGGKAFFLRDYICAAIKRWLSWYIENR
jgi:hypothetical protein